MFKVLNLVKVLLVFCMVFSIGGMAEASNNVAFLYVNKAETNCDKDIDLKINNAVQEGLRGTYNLVDGKKYMDRMEKTGITDIFSAERSDIVEAFANEPVDYVVFVELEPFIRKETMTVFTQGMQMTGTLEVKIIDLNTKKYLHVGKLIEKASDSTPWGTIGNKSVQLKSVDKLMKKFIPLMKSKLTDNTIKK